MLTALFTSDVLAAVSVAFFARVDPDWDAPFIRAALALFFFCLNSISPVVAPPMRASTGDDVSCGHLDALVEAALFLLGLNGHPGIGLLPPFIPGHRWLATHITAALSLVFFCCARSTARSSHLYAGGVRT